MLQGAFLLLAIAVVVANLIAELVYGVARPTGDRGMTTTTQVITAAPAGCRARVGSAPSCATGSG